MLLLGLEGVVFSDLYVLGGQLSRRVLGKSGFSFWAGTLFYVGILSAHVGRFATRVLYPSALTRVSTRVIRSGMGIYPLPVTYPSWT